MHGSSARCCSTEYYHSNKVVVPSSSFLLVLSRQIVTGCILVLFVATVVRVTSTFLPVASVSAFSLTMRSTTNTNKRNHHAKPPSHDSRLHNKKPPKRRIRNPYAKTQSQAQLPATAAAAAAKSKLVMPSSQMLQATRIELFFKTIEELQARIRLIQKYSRTKNTGTPQITSFNLVNKAKQDTMAEWITAIRELEEEEEDEEESHNDDKLILGDESTKIKIKTTMSICAHYSLKYNKVPRKGVYEQQQKLYKMLDTEYQAASEILIVSGSIPKQQQHKQPPPGKVWTTVEAVQSLGKRWQQQQNRMHTREEAAATATAASSSSWPVIAVAYNPYFPSPQDQHEENQRLIQKLQVVVTTRGASGGTTTTQPQQQPQTVVRKIYFQFGTDLQKLKTGIEFVKTNSSGSKITLAGSLFVPSAKLIAQQQFRPWKGVYLTPEFLRGPQPAGQIIVEMLKLYRQHDMELLWEAPGIRTEKDLATILDLMHRATTSSSTPATFPAVTTKDHDSKNHDDGNKKDVVVATATSDDGDDDGTKSSSDCCLLLFGTHDVRLQDNRAVEMALSNHTQVVPVFLSTTNSNTEIPDDDKRGGNIQGTAAAVCLEDALLNLQLALHSFQLPLICCDCTAAAASTTKDTIAVAADSTNQYGVQTIQELITKLNATAIYWNKEYTPEGNKREEYRKQFLLRHNFSNIHEYQSSLLYDVDRVELSTGFQNGGHFGTLMPYLKYCQKKFGKPSRPTPYSTTFRLLQEATAPTRVLTNDFILSSSSSVPSVRDLNLARIHSSNQQQDPKWDEPIRKRFPMNEKAAHDAMESFVRNGGMKAYEQERSRADLDGATSKLSPHLRIGTLSPNQLYWRIEDSGLPYIQIKTFSRRLFWRELAYYQLSCFPDMSTKSIRSHYEHMAWVGDDNTVDANEEQRRLSAWKKGMTGYPIVDAGMRELYATGWMTQSVRMVVASFLVEYLRISWKFGLEWFHYTLVDADAAINAMMWQNAGKSGTDQWNFVLSPTTASQDPTGAYTKRWVPELANLPTTNLIHRPWEAPVAALDQANIILGETYPHRIVLDLKLERRKSVESTQAICRKFAPQYKNDRGYDLIQLPNDSQTVVFTKKEYRIDQNGTHLGNNKQGAKTTNDQRNKKINDYFSNNQKHDDASPSHTDSSQHGSINKKRQPVTGRKEKDEKKLKVKL